MSLDSAISDSLASETEGGIVTDWLLIAAVIDPEHDNGQGGRTYRVRSMDGMPMHSVIGLATMASDIVAYDDDYEDDDDED